MSAPVVSVSSPLECAKCGKRLAWHFGPDRGTELVIRCSRCKHVYRWPPRRLDLDAQPAARKD